MICKVFSFLGGEDRSNEKQVFRAQFVTCFRVLKIRSRFSRIALFCTILRRNTFDAATRLIIKPRSYVQTYHFLRRFLL